jgi:hypothetical protein
MPWIRAFAGTTNVVSKPQRISIIVTIETDEARKSEPAFDLVAFFQTM